MILCAAEQVDGGDGARLGVVLALLYLPWLPIVIFQAAHTAAPWAERPSPLLLLGMPGGLFGYVAVPLLALAVFFALRAAAACRPRRRVLIGMATATAVLAWLCSQIEPAWATRYLAVVLGPLLLAFASVVSRGARWTAVALAGVAVVWLMSGPPPIKSNVRTVSTGVAPSIRPGDLVVSTQPEQVPALYRYLPRGVVYLTPMGLVSDPRQTDWRDGLTRLRAGPGGDASCCRRSRDWTAAPRADRHAGAGRAALAVAVGRAVRVRTREWRARLEASPRLRGSASVTTLPTRKNTVRAELYEVR